MRAMEISRSGLEVEWRRLEVIAQNVANANTVTTALGAPYRPMRLLSGPKADFAGQLAQGSAALQGVEAFGLAPLNVAPRRVLEPTHPQADVNGYVEYPGYDHAGEMTLMLKTSRAYEAGVVALSNAAKMYAKALELGGRR
jgi:flagellar basal-body rod protein FlgC